MEKRSCFDMQGLNLLFICHANIVRSRTAETIWDSFGWNARSAGISEGSEVRISPELIAWSDIIFVMEDYQHEFLQTYFAPHIGFREIVVLGIEDNYNYMQPELQEILKEKVESYLKSQPA
jgi:predicted protein tyrosine phosphatase